jgi:hypothetical protein
LRKESNCQYSEEESFELSYHPGNEEKQSDDCLIEFLESSKKEGERNSSLRTKKRVSLEPIFLQTVSTKVKVGNLEYE